jgi:transcriptional regulator with XRE-family HTH domain
MRTIDRLYEYLGMKKITRYAFERKCGIANGYLNKQFKGNGTIGPKTMSHIRAAGLDLSLSWLSEGTGSMLQNDGKESEWMQMQEDQQDYHRLMAERINALKLQIELLQSALADKDKIITLLERRALDRSEYDQSEGSS